MFLTIPHFYVIATVTIYFWLSVQSGETTNLAGNNAGKEI